MSKAKNSQVIGRDQLSFDGRKCPETSRYINGGVIFTDFIPRSDHEKTAFTSIASIRVAFYRTDFIIHVQRSIEVE